jgi:hypothetical protein
MELLDLPLEMRKEIRGYLHAIHRIRFSRLCKQLHGEDPFNLNGNWVVNEVFPEDNGRTIEMNRLIWHMVWSGLHTRRRPRHILPHSNGKLVKFFNMNRMDITIDYLDQGNERIEKQHYDGEVVWPWEEWNDYDDDRIPQWIDFTPSLHGRYPIRVDVRDLKTEFQVARFSIREAMRMRMLYKIYLVNLPDGKQLLLPSENTPAFHAFCKRHSPTENRNDQAY